MIMSMTMLPLFSDETSAIQLPTVTYYDGLGVPHGGSAMSSTICVLVVFIVVVYSL